MSHCELNCYAKAARCIKSLEPTNSPITLFNLWLPDSFLLLSHLLDVYLTSPPVHTEIEIQWDGINEFAWETFQSWPGKHTWLRNFLTPPHPHTALPTHRGWAKTQTLNPLLSPSSTAPYILNICLFVSQPAKTQELFTKALCGS